MSSVRVPTSNVLAWERPQDAAARTITLSSNHTNDIIAILRTVTDALYASQPQVAMQVSIRDGAVNLLVC